MYWRKADIRSVVLKVRFRPSAGFWLVLRSPSAHLRAALNQREDRGDAPGAARVFPITERRINTSSAAKRAGCVDGLNCCESTTRRRCPWRRRRRPMLCRSIGPATNKSPHPTASRVLIALG